MSSKSSYWTNSSVLSIAENSDPVKAITEKARTVVFRFIEETNAEPPFDPFAIAEYLKIPVAPREDVRDARTIHTGGGKFLIEFNPNRPRGRVRYSISHEIIHTLFPDCQEKIRNRGTHEDIKGDEWQLELVCNIGAAELLMPIGSFSDLQEQSLSINQLLEQRKIYDVSMEALLLRFVRLTKDACCVFSASRKEDGIDSYQIDYTVPSKSFQGRIANGTQLPKDTVVKECTAIGFTAGGVEEWITAWGKHSVECVGVPPYPGRQYPRVMGIIQSDKVAATSQNGISYLKGDALKPRGDECRIIAHIVNDKTPRWGAGFALEVRKRWPDVQEEFVRWYSQNATNLSLGNLYLSDVAPLLSIANLICQHGYGPSTKPRIRYKALKSCLTQLATIAKEENASVHMPRIGSGQAGGSWMIVSELIDEFLCQEGISVTVYDLPNAQPRKEPQLRFNFSDAG